MNKYSTLAARRRSTHSFKQDKINFCPKCKSSLPKEVNQKVICFTCKLVITSGKESFK